MLHNLPHDVTRCHGIACLERRKCARHTGPIPENVLLSWADNLNPERAHLCPEFIYNIQTNSHD